MTAKKKIISLCVMLSIVIIVLSLLIACDPNANNDDKASKNAEFVSFRKKIVTILKDNGIFVNDLDQMTAMAKEVEIGSAFSEASLLYADGKQSDEISQIGDLLLQDKYTANSEGYDFALKQIYSIALKMSLCIGDGMLNYFDENKIYNIAVFFPDMYMVITENGNKSCIYCYQKADDGVEHVQKIEVVFNSDNDYYFTVTEPTGDWIVTGDEIGSLYFYGDSSKRFLMFCAGSDATYTPNGRDFYNVTDKSVLDDCLDILGKDTFSYDVAEYRKIKDNVKHIFSNEQERALMDKYFKDVQSSTAPQTSEFVYENLDGKNVLMGYRAGLGETEVVIPSNVKYISENFYVEDIQSTVTALSIPASVTEIVDSDGKTVTEVNYARFSLMRQKGETLFQNITVAQGSPLFKSGSGHLTLKDGTVIYALDKASDTLNLDVIMCALMQTHTDIQYKNVYKVSSQSVSINSEDISRVAQTYGCDEYVVIEQIEKVLNVSSVTNYNFRINLPQTDNEKDPNWGAYFNLRLAIQLKSDVTINVDFGECARNDELSLGVAFVNKSTSKRNVTVNVNGFTYQTTLDVGPAQPVPDKGEEIAYQPNPSIQTTFNLDISEMYFDGLCYGRLIRDEQNSQIKFDSSQDGLYRYLSIYDANTNASYSELYCNLDVTNDVRDNDVIIIPDNLFGLTVKIVRIDVNAVADKSVTVVLSNLDEGFDRIEFYSSYGEKVSLSNADFVIRCECDMELLKSRIVNYDWDTNYAVSFTLQAGGESETFETGWEYGYGNPDNNEHRVLVYIDGQDQEILYSKRRGVVFLENCEHGFAYFVYPREFLYEPEDSDKKSLDVYVDGEGKLRCAYDEINDDVVYILVKQPLGEKTMNINGQGSRFFGDASVNFVEEKRENGTYFVGELSLTASPNIDNNVKIENLMGERLNNWFNFTYIRLRSEYEYILDKLEYVTYEDLCGLEMLIICYEDELKFIERDRYENREIKAYVNGKAITQTVKIYEGQYQVKFNVDDWGLNDIENYVFYLCYNSSRFSYKCDARTEIAFVREGGSVYAVCIAGALPRSFTLEKYELGSKRIELNGGNEYSLTVEMNFVRPEFIELSYGVSVDFNKSLFEINGTIEGRPVRGTAYVPYWYDIEYLDVEGSSFCKHYWYFSLYGDELRPRFGLLDKYETLKINIGDKTYDKRVIAGQQFVLDNEWFDLDGNYAYFWQIDGKLFEELRRDSQGRVSYYMPVGDDANPTINSLTLTRFASDTPIYFHLQDDDGQGNLYDLDFTLTVTLDNSLAIPESKVTVTASGKYNEGEIIGASKSSSLSSVSFVWDNGMETTPRRWIIERNGLDITFIGLGEYLF